MKSHHANTVIDEKGIGIISLFEENGQEVGACKSLCMIATERIGVAEPQKGEL